MVTKKKTEGKTAKSTSKGAEDEMRLLPSLDDGIGARIRQAREGRGWTQVVLSTRTRLADPEEKGISRTVIVGYEADTHKPGAREVKLLCEALHVTPNWLLFGQENPFETIQPSTGLPGCKSEVVSAIRLALVMLLLKPHERSTVTSLVLSLGGREIGDLRLASLSFVARDIADAVISEIGHQVGEDAEAIKSMSARAFIDKVSRAIEVNIGTKLSFNEETDEWEGEWLYRDPHPSDRTP